MTEPSWMIYGAYGYTGELSARLAVERGLKPVLAGRNETKLRALAEELGLQHRAFALDEAATGIAGMDVVAHIAGPYSATSRPMVDACLANKAHYLDVTGELPVFEAVFSRHAEARDAGVVLLPGAGFDVVPSDCLAAMLKERLPTATHLELFILALGNISQGTTKTMLEMMGEGGGAARIDGVIEKVPAAWKTREVELRDRKWTGISMPWGDVCTAWHSTGIPNITCYLSLPPSQRKQIARADRLAPILRLRPVQAVARKLVEWTVTGPSEQERQTKRSTVWGEVTDGNTVVSAVLETPEAYRLTADAVVTIATRLPGVEPGAHTPATAMGADFVTTLDGVLPPAFS